MCLSEIDLSPFLSENPPAPHDVWMEVSVSNSSDQTDVTVFKAHRLVLQGKVLEKSCNMNFAK